MLELVKWRDRLVFLSLGLSGALFSFALTAAPLDGSVLSRRVALYLIAPLAAEMGGLYLVIERRIYRIGTYFRDRLAPKVKGLLAGPEEPPTIVFSWEFPDQRESLTRLRRWLESIVLISAFSVSGAVAQLVIFIDRHAGRLTWSGVRAETPVLVGFLFALASFILFVRRHMFGRDKRTSPNIRQP